jgi:hypothetical protein
VSLLLWWQSGGGGGPTFLAGFVDAEWVHGAMKKNVASQVVGCQMVSATDGSAFTSSVTVAVTVDGGTQATGSVGSGACTHEGNGYHTYAPSQAETNGDLLAFTFTGTGAVPRTVQVYTTFPQTGDSFARVGAPAGASISADVAAVKAQTAAIETDTQDIQGRLPAALVSGRIDASVGDGSGFTAIPWNAAWDAEVQSEVADALAVYDPPTRAEATSDVNSVLAILGTPAGASLAADIAVIEGQTDDIGVAGAGLTALASQASVDTIDANVDSILADTGTDGVVVAAGSKTGYSLSNGSIAAATFAAGAIDAAALATDAVSEIADGLLNRNIAGGSSSGRLVKDCFRFMRNRKAIAAGTLTVYQEDDSTEAWTAAVTTAAGDPISELDPT